MTNALDEEFEAIFTILWNTGAFEWYGKIDWMCFAQGKAYIHFYEHLCPEP